MKNQVEWRVFIVEAKQFIPNISRPFFLKYLNFFSKLNIQWAHTIVGFDPIGLAIYFKTPP